MNASRVLPVLILAVLSGCGKKASPDTATTDAAAPIAVDLTAAKLRTVDEILDLQGTFGSNQGSLSRLASAAPGKVKAVYVKEGDRVRAGQLLATLDPRVQLSQVRSAAAALQSAQVLEAQAQTGYQTSKADQANTLAASRVALAQARSTGQSAIAQAKYTLQQSEADLARLRHGARPLELAQAHETTVQAQATRTRAQAEFNRNQALWPQGYISRRQLDDSRTALETATSVLAAAQDSENLLKAGARPEELAVAESRVAAARQALAAAEQASADQISAARIALMHARAGVLQVRSKEQDIANTRSVAAQRAADLATASATAKLLEIRAPFAGLVVKRAVAPGETVDTTTPVITIQKAGAHGDFVASGLPDQIASVMPGMTAIVEGKSGAFSGRVTSVTPPDTASSVSTVRIAVQGAPPFGSFGTAHVLLRKIYGAVVVPSGAVVQKGGKSVVFRNEKGVAKLIEVRLGPESHGFTTILGGLKAGDSIVAIGGNELDEGTKIAPAKAEAKGTAP